MGLRSTRGQVTGPDRKGGTNGIRLITTFEFGELLLAVVLRVERIRYSSHPLELVLTGTSPVSNNR